MTQLVAQTNNKKQRNTNTNKNTWIQQKRIDSDKRYPFQHHDCYYYCQLMPILILLRITIVPNHIAKREKIHGRGNHWQIEKPTWNKQYLKFECFTLLVVERKWDEEGHIQREKREREREREGEEGERGETGRERERERGREIQANCFST